MDSVRPEALTADAFSSLVRAHVDQVHDRVRRTGCAPAAAVRVVEASALDLLAPAHEGVRGPALTGRWFATAAALGASAARDPAAPHRPGQSDRSALAAAGLARRDEAARTALLLADVHGLPLPVTAAALGVDEVQTLQVLGRARLALLPDVFEGDPPHAGGCDDALLARLASEPAPDPQALRHVRSCRDCAEVLQAQQDVRGLLGELEVLPVPEHDRELLLERVSVRARATLPPGARSAAVVPADPPAGLLRPVPALLALLLAALVGVALGMLLSQPAPVRAAEQRALPPVVAPEPAVPELMAPPQDQPLPPVTTVFTYPPTPTTAPATPPAPSPTPPATPTPTASTTPSAPATSGPPAPAAQLTVSPAVGPAGRALQVSGSGWAADVPVRVVLLDPAGTGAPATQASVTTTPAANGSLRAVLTGWPTDGPAGTYRVVATQGTTTARATCLVVAT